MAHTTRTIPLLAAVGLVLIAAPAPAGTVYVANELSNTVSVIDTATRAVRATICLGSDPAIPGTPQPAGPCNGEAQHHSPFFNGHVGTHGLWLMPDGKVLLVANRISGTIVAIDTASNAVLGYTPVGREPHLATVRPGGKEAWVAVRGESHIDVLKLDPDQLFQADRARTERMERVASIPTVRGPSMISFTSDGRWAFVAAGKQHRVEKIDADSRRIVAGAPVAAAFTPFGLVSPDDRELYLVHKGAQKLSVFVEVKAPGWENEIAKAEGRNSPRLQQPKYVHAEARATAPWASARHAVTQTSPRNWSGVVQRQREREG